MFTMVVASEILITLSLLASPNKYTLTVNGALVSPFDENVIVAVPGAFAVTVPSAETVAIAGLLLVHEPVFALGYSVSVCDFPTKRLIAFEEITKLDAIDGDPTVTIVWLFSSVY